MKNKELFYRKSIISGIATELSIAARNRMCNSFFLQFPPTINLKILDLGTTSEEDDSSNYLERIYPYPQNITCAGIQDCSMLKIKFPGVSVVEIKSGENLPFADNEFDIVYSNAVLEHAGSRDKQVFFIKEALRVSKNYFITTPNRWFPIEHHTHIPFLHFLPQPIFRSFLSLIGESFYASENNLNICSESDLLDLFPKGVNIQKIWTLGFVSNLVAYGGK
jgi:SAM-dependent methyltransferase